MAVSASKLRTIRSWQSDNAACAAIILADAKYQGGLREWAEKIVEKERIKARELPLTPIASGESAFRLTPPPGKVPTR